MSLPNDEIEHDLELVRGVLAQEPIAIENLAERLRCVPRILAAQNAKLGHVLGADDLADITQDTIVILLRKVREYSGRAPLEAWVYRVCCYEFLNAVRRRRRREPGVDLQEAPQADEAAERGWQQLLAREALESGLARVGGVEAEAVRMKHFEERTFEDMGRLLALSTNTMKTRYYRGLARLTEILGAQFQQDEM